MRKFIIFIITISLQTPAFATMSLNCFEPSVRGNRVTHKNYYGERWIEPYRWRNYEEKPVNQWYKDTMQSQRQRVNADYKTYYNWNELQNHSFWK